MHLAILVHSFLFCICIRCHACLILEIVEVFVDGLFPCGIVDCLVDNLVSHGIIDGLVNDLAPFWIMCFIR